MRARRRIAGFSLGISALVSAIGLTLVVTPPASASRGIALGLSDASFNSAKVSKRQRWLDRAAEGGAGFIRVTVYWRGVVGGQPQHPREPSDPVYNFSALDATVND